MDTHQHDQAVAFIGQTIADHFEGSFGMNDVRSRHLAGAIVDAMTGAGWTLLIPFDTASVVAFRLRVVEEDPQLGGPPVNGHAIRIEAEVSEHDYQQFVDASSSGTDSFILDLAAGPASFTGRAKLVAAKPRSLLVFYALGQPTEVNYGDGQR